MSVSLSQVQVEPFAKLTKGTVKKIILQICRQVLSDCEWMDVGLVIDS
jgi:hypothetical protein